MIAIRQHGASAVALVVHHSARMFDTQHFVSHTSPRGAVCFSATTLSIRLSNQTLEVNLLFISLIGNSYGPVSFTPICVASSHSTMKLTSPSAGISCFPALSLIYAVDHWPLASAHSVVRFLTAQYSSPPQCQHLVFLPLRTQAYPAPLHGTVP